MEHITWVTYKYFYGSVFLVKQMTRDKQKKLEDISYKSIVLSGAMIFLGLLLGSFIKYTVHLASLGIFILLIGIILYIIAQMR